MTFVTLNSSNQPEVFQIESPLKSAVFITMPAAFSPGCSNAHFPSLLKHERDILNHVSHIYIVTTDSAFSLEAWKKSILEKHGISETKIQMLSDIDFEFGNRLNISKHHPMMGNVLKRTASYFNDLGELEWLVEDEIKMDKTSGREILQRLQRHVNQQNQQHLKQNQQNQQPHLHQEEQNQQNQQNQQHLHLQNTKLTPSKL